MATELTAPSDREVIECASGRAGVHARWMATDELARRALEQEDVLDALCAAIRQDRAIAVRYYIPYGTFMAVARILASGNERAIRRLFHKMDDWTAVEQQDAIGPWAGYRRVAEATRQLVARHGWAPKYVEGA